MSASPTIPVTVTPEAAARAAQLGIQADLERVYEHLRRTVTGLRSLEVSLEPPYESEDDRSILIDAYRNVSHRPDDPTWNEWCKWASSTFPPQVLEHFTVMFHFGAGHAG